MPDINEDRALVWEPAKTGLLNLLTLGLAAGVAWWLGGIQVAILVAVIVGFAFNAIESVFVSNARAIQLIKLTNLLVALTRELTSQKGGE